MAESLPLEILLSKCFKTEAEDYVRNKQELIEQMLPICLTDAAPMCWRAAWMIRTVIEEDDERVKPYINKILKVLPEKKDGHQRELIKLLRRMNLSEDQESVLYDISVTIWESVRKKPSVRSVAIEHVIAMVQKYPELKHELDAITQPQHINSLSPGIKSVIMKQLTKLNR